MKRVVFGTLACCEDNSSWEGMHCVHNQLSQISINDFNLPSIIYATPRSIELELLEYVLYPLYPRVLPRAQLKHLSASNLLALVLARAILRFGTGFSPVGYE